MNNTITSFHNKNGYSIKISKLTEHLISGSFNPGHKKQAVPFSGIINAVTPIIHTTSFLIDWKELPEGVIKARTAFHGFIKLNRLNPLICLDWLMNQHFYYSPDVEFTSSGKSLLSEHYRPELDTQVHEDKLPYPHLSYTPKYFKAAKAIQQLDFI